MCRNKDPCGIVMVIVTQLLLYFGCYVCNRFGIFFLFWQSSKEKRLVRFIPLDTKWTLLFLFFNYSCAMAAISHLRASCSNPGTISPLVKAPNKEEKLDIKHCSKCNFWKPPRAHHCSECGTCVMRMDHHCPWVNNCVGVKNNKYFTLFLLYTGLAAFVLAGTVAVLFVVLFNSNNLEMLARKKSSSAGMVMCILGFLEGVLFAIFCL